MKKATLIIPCYNEEEAITEVLEAVLDKIDHEVWDILVVNDGSTDGTRQRLADYEEKIAVLDLEQNTGYGSAIKLGVHRAKTEWIATFDADGQHRVEDLLNMYAVRHGYDAVIGVRGQDSPQAMRRIPGKYVLRHVANFLAGTKVPDINCGLRVMRRKILSRVMRLTSDRFSFSTSTLICLIKARSKLKYFTVTTNRRRAGGSTVRQLKDGLQTILLIIRLIVLFEPLRIFLPVGIGLFLLGFVYQLYAFVTEGQNVIDLAVLLMLSGLIVGFFALVVDQVSALRRQLIELDD